MRPIQYSIDMMSVVYSIEIYIFKVSHFIKNSIIAFLKTKNRILVTYLHVLTKIY